MSWAHPTFPSNSRLPQSPILLHWQYQAAVLTRYSHIHPTTNPAVVPCPHTLACLEVAPSERKTYSRSQSPVNAQPANGTRQLLLPPPLHLCCTLVYSYTVCTTAMLELFAQHSLTTFLSSPSYCTCRSSPLKGRCC